MELQPEPIRTSVNLNLEKLQQLFLDNESFVLRNFNNAAGTQLASMVYLNVLIDDKSMNQHIIPKINKDIFQMAGPADESILQSIHSLGTIKVLSQVDEVVSMIANAGFVVFVEGCSSAYGMSLPGYETRPIEEPKIEINVRGPRESFTEDLQKNLTLVYRKLKTPELKSKSYVIGKQSQTKVIIMYLDDKVNVSVLAEVKRRLDSIRLDILIADSQIEEYIQESTFSPFPQILNTERPDRVVTALNRGKVAILTDGTPIALITPSTFFEMLHPSEDLYERFYFANFLRVLRLITLFISLFGPSLYIALTTFHLEMIPTPLMMAFISSKAGIPFPTFVEALIMEVAFEVLREASLRLPRAVGQSVGIVGALIIGEAAVQSGIVSTSMVIVVATTGIASFTIPAFSTAIALRMLRFPLMLLAAYVGVFGISLGMFIIIIHLCSLQFSGVLFLNPIDSDSVKKTLLKFILFPAQYRTAIKAETNIVVTQQDKGGSIQSDEAEAAKEY
jgi:hypothetical protein